MAVIIEDQALQRLLTEQKKRALNLKPIMQVIAQDMQSRKDLSMRLGKDPDGKAYTPLSAATTAKRANRKRPAPTMSIKPLLDTGSLRASFRSNSDHNSASLGTNKPQAKVMQYGHVFRGTYKTGKQKGYSYSFKVPARRMVGITAQMRVKYNRMVKNYILSGRRS